MMIYNIREVLRTSVEKKLNADVTDAGTMLDGTGADFAFELKDRRYDIQIKDITEEEEDALNPLGKYKLVDEKKSD